MKLLFVLILSFSVTARADEGLKLLDRAFVPEFNVVSQDVESSNKKCVRSRVQISTPDPLNTTETREIEYVLYEPQKELLGTVIMMPPTGGVSFIDRQLAHRFCRRNLRVLLNYSFTDDMASGLEPDIHEKAFVRGITAIRHMALTFDGDFSVLGTSLGSLYASQALAVEPRINKALLVVGGAPIIDILAHSEQDGLVALREKRMANLGLKGKKAYKEYLRPHFRLDLLSRIQPEQKPKIWVIRSLKDDTVPTFTQDQLVETLSPYKVTNSKAGHARSIFNLLFKKNKIADFFIAE